MRSPSLSLSWYLLVALMQSFLKIHSLPSESTLTQPDAADIDTYYYTLRDDQVLARFDGRASSQTFGLLTELATITSDGTVGSNVIGAAAAGNSSKDSSLWSASFVGTGSGIRSISSATAKCIGRQAIPSNSTLAFKWYGCSVDLKPPAMVNVTVEIDLNNGLLEYSILFEGKGDLSLWDYTLAIANIQVGPTTATLASASAKQLVGIYDSRSSDGDAVYFAAHDPKHVVKSCSASISAGSGSLQCTVLSTNATIPLHAYQPGFVFAVTVLKEGDWWDIASRYRAWVLPNAEWTKLGPLETRTDLPDWLENITLWMNNNWGKDPLGPNYGGDPEYVKNEMLQVNAALDLPSHGGRLALHWYEWDTLGYAFGSNHTQCDRTGTAPCGFDTHYPNYFPARALCQESLAAMQAAGMRVIPYINGQLFDTLIPRWTEDHATLAVQKFLADKTMTTPSKTPALKPHLEHFDGITSAVMCPATEYWHRVMRDTIVEIVNGLGFDGCYVDQVGNGEQRNCADPTHNHTINGGSFWAEAFYDILAEVRAAIPEKSAMFMTEGIVEEVSGTGFDIMLGLDWNERPVWHTIYGGHVYATGRAGSISRPLNAGLCSELTAQFMVGGTMGWFTYQNYKNQFFDPANADEVAYIQKLSKSRILAKAWMVHGRATRTLELNDSTKTLKGGCFLRDGRESVQPTVVCAVALPTRSAPAKYTLDMAPPKYGLGRISSGSKIQLSDLVTGEPLGSYTGGSSVTYSAMVQPFEVQLLKLEVASLLTTLRHEPK